MVIRKLGFSVLAVCGLTLTACPGDDGEGEDTNVTTATMTATDSSGTGTDAGTDSGMETSDGSTGEPGTGSDTAGISHEADMQPIWDANCVDDCHEPGGNWSFVDMSGDAYDVLVLGEGTPTQTTETMANMPLVMPSDREQSYLWHKINGTHIDVGGSGVQMPANPDLTAGPPLDQATIDLIGEWIDAGAPE